MIIPTYGIKLNENPAEVVKEWNYTGEILQLAPAPKIDLSITPKQASPASTTKPKSSAAADMAL